MQFNLQANDITDDSVNARGQELFDIKNNLESSQSRELTPLKDIDSRGKERPWKEKRNVP